MEKRKKEGKEKKNKEGSVFPRSRMLINAQVQLVIAASHQAGFYGNPSHVVVSLCMHKRSGIDVRASERVSVSANMPRPTCKRP